MAGVKDGVWLYADSNYQGKNIRVDTHNPNIGVYSPINMNDLVSSVRIVGSYEVILYEHMNFQGRSIKLTGNAVNLKDFNFNDTATSIQIFKR
ncbi:beta/gamma crystallin-related protein [Brevibacillus sp. FIR094]|uniref:beta/gamma crystallin-related protein n=1 Tax=Brevibacillus sp. FIR094 TaxID=3134809 RepID=UPI003D219333